MSGLEIGDRVRFRGELWRVRGFTPVGVIPARIELEHVATGELCAIAPEQLADAKSLEDEPDRDTPPRSPRQ